MLKRAFWVALLAFSVAVTGCSKKSEMTSSEGTGFDSISTVDELSQLPPVSSTTAPIAVEALPIETSPVTQGIPVASTPVAAAVPAVVDTAISSLSQDKKIQTALRNAGFYQGNIDGKLGPMSKKAIEAFQASKGLKVDGKVGPKTWAALEPYLSGSSQVTSIDNTANTIVQ